MSALASRFAAKISQTINSIGVTCRVYDADHATLSDGNVVSKAATLVGSVKAFIDKGSQEAQDMAGAIGVYGDLAAIGYFRHENVSYIQDRRILVDETGQGWIMHSVPLASKLPDTVGVQCLLTILKIKPSGVS